METKRNSSREGLSRLVDGFWEAFPPLWNLVRGHIRQVATEQFEISVEQFHILRHIRRGQGSVSELAKVKNISRPAISQAVDALVQRGFISRNLDSQDRRHIPLSLTAAGNTLLDSISNDTRRWMMQRFASLSEEELDVLARAMAIIRKIPAG